MRGSFELHETSRREIDRAIAVEAESVRNDFHVRVWRRTVQENRRFALAQKQVRTT